MEKALMISAFSCYAAALALALPPWKAARAAGWALFAAGSVLNLGASAHRGFEAGHFPFSNMYETMMTLGACMFPLALLTRRKAGGSAWIDPLIAAVVVFPSAFNVGRAFQPEIRLLPPALQSPFFFPHVASYLLSYAALARAFLLGLAAVFTRDPARRAAEEARAHGSAALGFPLLTAGLLLGAFWAKYAWGDYWSWDPKEVWALITWLVFLVYFHMRFAKKKDPGWSAFLLGLGFAAMVVTLLIVNLTPVFGGLHAYA